MFSIFCEQKSRRVSWRLLHSSSIFGTLIDKLIRDKLVIGIIGRGTKSKLSREKSLTIDKAIDIARSNEITSKQLETMKADNVTIPKEEVNLVEKEKGRDFKQSSGKSRQRIVSLVKRNRRQILETPKSAKTVALNTSETNVWHTTNVAITVKNGTDSLVCVWLRRKVWSISYRKVRIVQIQRSQFSKCMEDVSSVESCGNRWFAMLSFCCEHNKLETKLKCQLATGATHNVLSHRDLSVIKQDGNCQMESSKTNLKLFDGSLMIVIIDTDRQVLHGGQTQVPKFQVVSGSNKSQKPAKSWDFSSWDHKLKSTLDVQQVSLTA